MPFTMNLRVRLSETDSSGIVHHSSYLIYYEIARFEAMREIGLLYPDLEKLGCILVVTNAGQKYKAPAFCDDVLTISTWLRKINPFIARFEYLVTRDNTEIGSGYTEVMSLSTDVDFKPTRWPEHMLEQARVYVESA